MAIINRIFVYSMNSMNILNTSSLLMIIATHGSTSCSSDATLLHERAGVGQASAGAAVRGVVSLRQPASAPARGH